MTASTAFPFARAAAAFAAYERNARDAVHWVHPSWLAAALGVDAGALDGLRAALATAARAQVEACSLALLRTLGVPAPSFDALRAPNLAVLDALPPQWGLRVLRMRSLALRRADVRRLIDKRNRMQLSEYVGVSLDRLTGRGLLPALDRLDADTLACEGYALMARDACSVAAPFGLLRLALPRNLPASPWLDDGGRELDAGGTARLVARLPELLPEWAWLFG
jgi:type III secretion system HrpB4-like protein